MPTRSRQRIFPVSAAVVRRKPGITAGNPGRFAKKKLGDWTVMPEMDGDTVTYPDAFVPTYLGAAVTVVEP